jgi:hypothetical protein
MLRLALYKFARRRTAIPKPQRLLTPVVAFTPIVAIVAGLPFANRIEPILLGLPFLLFWIAGWVLLTPAFLGLAYLLRRTGGDRADGRAGQ